MIRTSKEANARYDAKSTRHYGIKLNIKTDADLIAALDAAPSKQTLIKEALRTYLKRGDKAMSKTYGYKGLFPYSAADLAAMDAFVGDAFSGNVTEELIRQGAMWDDEKKTLTVPGMAFPIDFVERG